MTEFYPSCSDAEDDESTQRNPLILVTGGTGLVGTAIRRQAGTTQFRWVFASSTDCDLSGTYEAVAEYFSLLQPTHVIHLAARVGGLYRNQSENLEMYQINMRINSNVMRACHDYNVQRVILCLSTCVFPDAPPAYPLTEEMLHAGPPHPSNAGYAYAKRMMQVEAKLRNDTGQGPQFSCVIPTNVYGPNDNFNLQDAHVIPALIRRCYEAKRDNIPFVVRGTGAALRQFVHADDLARIMLRMVSHSDVIPGLIVAPPQEHSIRSIVLQIARTMGYPEEGLVWQSQYSDGQLKKPASNALLMQHFPDETFIDLESGLTSTIDWFQQNYAHARK